MKTILYINEFNVLNYKTFEKDINGLYQISISEPFLIVGIISNNLLLEPNNDRMTSYDLLPFERYLMASTNVDFKIQNHHFRTPNVPFYLKTLPDFGIVSIQDFVTLNLPIDIKNRAFGCGGSIYLNLMILNPDGSLLLNYPIDYYYAPFQTPILPQGGQKWILTDVLGHFLDSEPYVVFDFVPPNQDN